MFTCVSMCGYTMNVWVPKTAQSLLSGPVILLSGQIPHSQIEIQGSKLEIVLRRRHLLCDSTQPRNNVWGHGGKMSFQFL